MTTPLTKPVRRLVGEVVVELGPDGITFRAPRCRRRVFIPYAEAVEAAIDRDGWRVGPDVAPAKQLRRLLKRRRGQPRTLFDATRAAQ